MLYFDDFQISFHNDFIELTADTYIQFHSGCDENVEIGLPKCWPDTIVERLTPQGFDVYHIYTTAVPKEQVSRVMDHRGIWGMLRIPKGEHCDYYDCANSRIYYGIRKGVLPNGIYDYAAPLQLILPRTESDRLGEIAQCVCTNQIGSTNPDMFDLRVLQKQFQSAYILRFRCFPTPSMKMICPSGARIFREADVELWNKAKEVGIYKIYPFV